MEINQKVAGGLMSRFFVKTPAVRVSTASTKVKVEKIRVIHPFYAFVSTKKDKQEDGSILESQEIKFRLSKEFTESVLNERVGTIDITEPILYLFSKDSEIPAALFKGKVKKAKEGDELVDSTEKEVQVQATVFRFEPLVDNLKVNEILPENYGQKDDENFILDITDITSAYLLEVADEDKDGLPADFSVFRLSKGVQVEKEEKTTVESGNESVVETPVSDSENSLQPLAGNGELAEEVATVSDNDDSDLWG